MGEAVNFLPAPSTARARMKVALKAYLTGACAGKSLPFVQSLAVTCEHKSDGFCTHMHSPKRPETSAQVPVSSQTIALVQKFRGNLTHI